jgi:tetratricopeptide (TPR) repeat protein
LNLTPQAAFQMGMLAAYRRDPQAALDYFHQAAQADPSYSDAFEGIVWMLNSQAMNDFSMGNLPAAAAKIAEARQAAEKTDPTDPNALTQRGYLAKMQAQLAEAQGNMGLRNQFLQEAGRFFQGALRYDPNFVYALNGQGNVQYFLGDLDGAIQSIRRAVELNPAYAAAHNDLAIAYEAKTNANPGRGQEWRRKALEEWKLVLQLAQNDPTFPTNYQEWVRQRIQYLS